MSANPSSPITNIGHLMRKIVSASLRVLYTKQVALSWPVITRKKPQTAEEEEHANLKSNQESHVARRGCRETEARDQTDFEIAIFISQKAGSASWA